MANIVGTHLAEGQSTSRPPQFNGTNYNYWKLRMMIYLQATDYDIWRIIVNGPTYPTKIVEGQTKPKPENEWDELDKRMVQINAKAKHHLVCALDVNEFNRVSGCDTAKEMWDKLEVTYEGTNQVKESKVSMLVHKYELFKMEDDESISNMFTRFTDIINGLKALGKTYSNVEMVRKVLRCLPRSWEPKVTAIQEAKDLTVLSLDELMGSLMTHEIVRRAHDDEETKRKKGIAFKTTSSPSDGDQEEEESDEDIALLTRKFNKFVKRNFRGQRGPRKGGYKEEAKKDQIICYECKKPGHMKADCPKAKKNPKKDGKSYKKNKDKDKGKSLVAAWGESGDESSDEDESSDNEVANLCLMAKGDDEVKDELNSFDELQLAFEELFDDSQRIIAKNALLKKQVVSLSLENESLKTSHIASHDTHALHDLKNENISLKSEIDVLKKRNEDLLCTLAKFTKGLKNLNLLLSSQR